MKPLSPISAWRHAQGSLDRFRTSTQGELLRLAIPAVGEQLLSLMVGLVDTFLVGHLGQQALAAVALSNQWVTMTLTLFQAVAVGTTALIARAVGAQDWKLANRALRQSMILGVVIGLLATVLLFSLAAPAVTLLGPQEETAPISPDVTQDQLSTAADTPPVEDNTLPLATTYLRIVSSIFFFSTLMFVANAAMRGAGDTRTPFLIMLVVNGLNAVLAWILVNGFLGLPQLGVAGSALGAAVGRASGGILAIVLLLRGRRGLRLSLARLRPDFGTIARILRVGLPSGVESILFRTGQMIFFFIVSGLGTAALAAQHVALQATSISFLPGFGFAVASTTLVGQGLGAKGPRRAERSGYLAFLWGGGLMLGMGLFLLAFPRAFIHFFTQDPEVIALGTTPLRIIGLAQPSLAAMMIFSGALRGAGDTRAPLLINVASLWSVRVPLAALFTQGATVFSPVLSSVSLPSWLQDGLGWGLQGAWIALAIDLTLRGTLLLLRFRGGRWKRIQV